MTAFFARHALLVDRWARDVRIEADEHGRMVSITPDSSRGDATLLDGIVLPGMPNAHSHAFQRAMAGRAEVASGRKDSFWTWREAMYASIATMGPDEFEKVTTEAFVAMRRAGYTRVCEFHYVHNAPDGTPYDDPNELAHRVVLAARAAGIRLTLLPVLYRYSDFGAEPPRPQQRRFVRTFDAYAEAWLALHAAYRDDPTVLVGIAPHSLRAVGLDDLRALFELGSGGDSPFHIHIAEQRREVEACVDRYGAAPITLLAHTVPHLGDRWCLVHATHATERERAMIAESSCVVALCPTTEANLGDGMFRAAEFVERGGRIALGSDSNVSIDVGEELRWLEYVQRLMRRERNVFHDERIPNVARYLWMITCVGGSQAAFAPGGILMQYAPADFIVLDCGDTDDPDLALSRAVFASGAWKLTASVVAGKLASF